MLCIWDLVASHIYMWHINLFTFYRTFWRCPTSMLCLPTELLVEHMDINLCPPDKFIAIFDQIDINLCLPDELVVDQMDINLCRPSEASAEHMDINLRPPEKLLLDQMDINLCSSEKLFT